MGNEVSADERVQRKGLLAEDLIAYLSLILLIHIVEHLNLVYQYGHCFVPKVRLSHHNCFFLEKLSILTCILLWI